MRRLVSGGIYNAMGKTNKSMHKDEGLVVTSAKSNLIFKFSRI